MTADDLIRMAESTTYDQLRENGSPEFNGLMHAATEMFERFTLSDQSLALAIMFGCILSECASQPNQFELENNVIITPEDRLRLFAAQAMVVYRAAYKAKMDEQQPTEKARVN